MKQLNKNIYIYWAIKSKLIAGKFRISKWKKVCFLYSRPSVFAVYSRSLGFVREILQPFSHYVRMYAWPLLWATYSTFNKEFFLVPDLNRNSGKSLSRKYSLDRIRKYNPDRKQKFNGDLSLSQAQDRRSIVKTAPVVWSLRFHSLSLQGKIWSQSCWSYSFVTTKVFSVAPVNF